MLARTDVVMPLMSVSILPTNSSTLASSTDVVVVVMVPPLSRGRLESCGDREPLS